MCGCFVLIRLGGGVGGVSMGGGVGGGGVGGGGGKSPSDAPGFKAT